LLSSSWFVTPDIFSVEASLALILSLYSLLCISIIFSSEE